jgi:protein involved in polysaccharide export with SLBB domain
VRRAQWQVRLTLGPGDVLDFHLYGAPELTQESVPVGPDGTISYLEAQNIAATGLTVDELRGRINAELARYRVAAQAYITPVSYRSKKYYMLGTVVHKGVFYLDHTVTVVEAVARARGFETGVSKGDTVDATDFSRSFLARGGHRVPVDFERLFMHGDLSQNVALEPNDYLYFSATGGGQIFVLGAVGLPGPVAYDPDISALSAIVSRGGFTERAWKAHVLVLRGSLDHPVAFKVDMDGALTGNAPNLALQPGDLVYVSDRPWIKAEELLDHAASAFVESAVVTWAGLNVGPNIISRP